MDIYPSISFGLYFDPQELNTALKGWLGVNPSVGLDGNLMAYPLCPDNSLDPFGVSLCYLQERRQCHFYAYNAICDVHAL